jgi:hypothetical protein
MHAGARACTWLGQLINQAAAVAVTIIAVTEESDLPLLISIHPSYHPSCLIAWWLVHSLRCELKVN